MNDPSVKENAIAVKFSLRYKLLIWFTLVFLFVFVGIYTWFYQYSYNTATERLYSAIENLTAGTIAGIDGDTFDAMVKSAVPNDSGVPSGDARYSNHQAWLDEVHNLDPRAYAVYTYVAGSQQDEILWVGDNYRIIEPDNATSWLESYIRTPDSLIMEGFVELTLNRNIYTDPWGSHVSAYGPIKNSAGEVVGAVGIDMQADEVISVRKAVQTTFLGVSILATIIMIVLVLIVSNILAQPIIKLTQAAQNVGEGNYDQEFGSLTKSKNTDEIDVLAHNFAIMVSKVDKREQGLRQQLQQLRIEIDDSKRNKQVSEIVDSDFFRDLKDKAQEMRNRAHQP